MRIRYETGVATFIQFIVGAGLSFLSGGASIVGGCRGTSGADCATNAFVSLILIIITIAAYAFVLGLGYVAQERRSSRLAYTLIAIEGFALLIFLFDAKHAPALFDRATNAISALMALWVIYVAWRLSRAHGSRIVRTRRRAI